MSSSDLFDFYIRSDGIPRLNITQFVPHQLSCFGYDRRDQGIIVLSPGENEKSVAKAQKRAKREFLPSTDGVLYQAEWAGGYERVAAGL